MVRTLHWWKEGSLDLRSLFLWSKHLFQQAFWLNGQKDLALKTWLVRLYSCNLYVESSIILEILWKATVYLLGELFCWCWSQFESALISPNQSKHWSRISMTLLYCLNSFFEYQFFLIHYCNVVWTIFWLSGWKRGFWMFRTSNGQKRPKYAGSSTGKLS